MSTQHNQTSNLTGRLQQGPDALLHEEILQPQFTYEMQHLLAYYLRIEKAMLLEYQRLELISPEAVHEIAFLLQQIETDGLQAEPNQNLSDIAFAIERYVEGRLSAPVSGWHMDRSRNDFQATAQLMLARAQVLLTINTLLTFGRVTWRLADQTTEMPMPGYTHYQAAQIITPGFYLAGVNEQVLASLRRLFGLLDEINRCPLGSGAMAGLELPWDRDRMAYLLGFATPQPLALTGVASRDWVLQIAGELSTFGVTLSRIVTDFLHWGSGEYGFIELPDDLASISSAMPQKKNLTILERIRGKTAHASAYYIDFALGQRNTPYSNLVEVSKEAGSNLMPMFQSVQSALRLFTAVMEHIQFRADRMLAACEADYFGGFALANALTRQDGIPYRKAQAIVGAYIVAMMAAGRRPDQADAQALRAACEQRDCQSSLTEAQIRLAFDVRENLLGKRSAGSTRPEAVCLLLQQQAVQFEQFQAQSQAQQSQLTSAYQSIDQLLLAAGKGKVASAPRQGYGAAFGTFGELLQGRLPESDLDFLVTLPIDRYARATFIADPSVCDLIVVPPHKEKSRLLALRILQHYEVHIGGILHLSTDMDEGKGLASSTADMVATARAISACFDIRIPRALLQQFLGDIEPTDGVMYDSIVAYFHRRSELCKSLGSLPAMSILAIDEGGVVDTVAFNKIPKPFTQEEKMEYSQLLCEMEQAIANQDLRTVGRIATRSAEINQKLRPKAHLDEMKALAESVGALGVAVAHSGTVLGILLSPASPDYPAQFRQVSEALYAMSDHVMTFQTLSY